MVASSLKEKVAKEFIGDARDYLTRYSILKENSFSHIGMRSKLTGELLFSAECSLKALIFLTSSGDDLQKIYPKIIEHSLTKLLNKLPSEEKKECSKYLDDFLMTIKVDGRYQFEAQRTYRNSVGVLDERYYSTISNIKWHEKVFTELQNLLSYVESKVKVWIETVNLEEINIGDILQENQIISNLHK